jgi:DNA-binding transcriptional ArsR family regulator
MPNSTPDRGEDGTFTPQVPDDEILDAVAELEPAGTADVGEAVGLARQNADYRLRQLRDDGRVESAKIGGALAWATVSSAATDTDSEDDRRPAADPDPEPEPAGAEGGVGVDVDALTFKRELTTERREVLEAWLTHVREGEDGVTKSDFTAWWGDDRAAGTGYSKPGSFWEAFVKAAMKQSEQFHKPNARTYRWVGEE